MEREIAFREIKNGEELRACQLVMESFNEFVAPDYGEKGVIEFSKYVNPQLMRQRLVNNHFVIVALDKDVFAGIIELRNYNHVSLLFVKSKYHRHGIAKTLLETAIDKCRQHNTNLSLIEVNSSPFAIQIYEKLGFVKTNIEQVKNGIRFTSMIKKLN
jgi:GNAT superfamily N-acetyltransferase